MNGRKIKALLIQIEEFLNLPRSKKTVKRIALSIFGVIVLLSTYFLSASHIGQIYSYKLGDIVNEDIRIMRDLRYPVPEETKIKKEAARNSIPPVYDREDQILRKVIDTIQSELSYMLRLKPGIDIYDKVSSKYPYLKTTSSISRSDVEEMLFNSRNRDNLSKWAAGYAALVFDTYGILEEEPIESEGLGVTIQAKGEAIGSEQEFTRTWDKLVYYKNIYKYQNFIQLIGLGTPEFRNLITEKARKIITRRVLQLFYASPYIHYNAVETEKRKAAAANAVKPVYNVLKKGLTIARAGDPVNESMLENISIVNQYQGQTNVQSILGIFLVQLLLALGISYFIYKFSDVQLRDLQSYIILGVQIIIMMVLSFFLIQLTIIRDSNIPFALFIPLGLVSTIGSLLLGTQITFVAGVFLSVFLFMIAGNELPTFIISLLSIITGIYSTFRMEKRTQFIKNILLTGTVISIAIIGSDLSSNQISSLTKWKIAAAYLNAMLGIIMATGLLPFYENVFNLPTPFRLMELSDFNHPLLKKMSEEAPSSYTHSIMMASLSERAVSSIGGDPLLARVGCLYHDIGKMNNAEIYAENKHLQKDGNRTMGMAPEKYAQTIIRHVSDGIEMARAYRLPEKIISFIPEHHGTSLMRYFYHEALKNEKNEPPDKRKFKYPGPKPQTKETAVVMIADSLEAASRSIPNPTGGNLENLVDSIMKNKIDEGQLDECPLTLYDLKKVKDSFLQALLSTYHLRPKYPTNNQTEKLEKKITEAQEAPENKTKTKKNTPRKNAKKQS